MNFWDKLLSSVCALPKRYGSSNVRPGDTVTILPYDEILRTLDTNNCCDGLLFMENMRRYCGRDYKVLKQVKWVYDEKCKKMLSCRDVVVLSGPVCDGKGMLSGKDCDRCCTLLWKTSWLKNS